MSRKWTMAGEATRVTSLSRNDADEKRLERGRSRRFTARCVRTSFACYGKCNRKKSGALASAKSRKKFWPSLEGLPGTGVQPFGLLRSLFNSNKKLVSEFGQSTRTCEPTICIVSWASAVGGEISDVLPLVSVAVAVKKPGVKGTAKAAEGLFRSPLHPGLRKWLEIV